MAGEEEAPGRGSPVTGRDIHVTRDYFDLNIAPTCQADDADSERAVHAGRRLSLAMEVEER
jgi:hypothetical protein